MKHVPHSVTPEMKQRMVDLQKQGLSGRAIARQLECSHGAVYTHLATLERDPLVFLKRTNGPLSRKVTAKTVAFTKNTKVVMPDHIKIQRNPFVPYPGGPVCNSMQTERYSASAALSYRK